MQIAIDGPAGAGKSTIAKKLARELGIIYYDTGAMYRAFAYAMLKNKLDCNNIDDVKKQLADFNFAFSQDKIMLNGEDIQAKIRTENVSKNASIVAAFPEVRTKMVALQQKDAKEYDIVMEGRDICAVVLPDADYKFFITASAEERAKRRFEQLQSINDDSDYEEILKAIKERDYFDANRDKDPLKQAPDAELIDTSNMTIEEVITYIKNKVAKKK